VNRLFFGNSLCYVHRQVFELIGDPIYPGNEVVQVLTVSINNHFTQPGTGIT
jgi:hypothetical protein